MSLNKKLVALLGGRQYKDSLTLRKFLTPSIRQNLSKNGIDFIIATNNKKAEEQFKQIEGIKVIGLSEELHNSFINRQREEKPNLGAETREIINQYAIENNYEYALHLDDNIIRMRYVKDGKTFELSKQKPEVFFHTMILLFNIIENSNFGALGMEMSAFQQPKDNEVKLSSGFAYSFFVHKVDKNYQFENATEDDILMNIYNGINKKPSVLLRNFISYGKTGKKSQGGGNRKLYNDLLKENKRGTYVNSLYPNIYTMKVGYNIKSSFAQKEPFLQHKHTLRKPKEWDNYMQYDKEKVNMLIKDFKDLIETNYL
jgi:hypothetical protein